MFEKFFISKVKRRLSSYAGFLKIGFWVGIILLVVFFFVFILKPIGQNIIGSPQFFLNLVTRQDSTLRQTSGRTNILIMGIGGENHDGPLLTDSIMLASIRLKDNDVAVITIPRDIWVDPLKGKINEAYALGESKRKGAGLVLAKASVGEIFNLPVHYVFVVDFKAFSEAVDFVGGIDVDVENTFDDFKYPIVGKENDLCEGDKELKCRYEHIHFDKGKQHMNGELALKFVRSRYSEGLEGTDFARSKRQIKVLMALKNKITDPKIFLNPKNISELANKFQNDTATDLNAGQELFLAKKFINFNPSQIRTFPLDIGNEANPGLLINPPMSTDYGGAWVLIPRSGNWQGIKNKIKEFLQL